MDITKTIDFETDAQKHTAAWRTRIRAIGVSQDDVCKGTRIAPSTLSLYMDGKLNPRMDKFWKIESFIQRREKNFARAKATESAPV